MTHPQEQRRKHAIARYLAGEKIDVICRDLHCSKSWLYKWRARYQRIFPEDFGERRIISEGYLNPCFICSHYKISL